jgi:putative hydrolase of HD superfamily
MTENKMKKLLPYTHILKHLPRTGWVNLGIDHPESVASHSWNMAVLALSLAPQAKNIDINRVIRLCLVHDIAESIVGDLTPKEAVQTNKSEQETDAMTKISQEADFNELKTLFAEYEANNTPEAHLAHDLDCLDMYAQALCYKQQDPKNDVSEFLHSAESRIHTELGLQLLSEIKD